MFKRMMLLGAVASALALAGCQDRRDEGMGGAGSAGTDVHGSEAQTGGSVDDQDTSGGLGSWGQGTSDTSGPLDNSGSYGSENIGSGTSTGTGGAGNLGGSVDDQGSTGSVDGLDGEDSPPVDQNSEGNDEAPRPGTEIR